MPCNNGCNSNERRFEFREPVRFNGQVDYIQPVRLGETRRFEPFAINGNNNGNGENRRQELREEILEEFRENRNVRDFLKAATLGTETFNTGSPIRFNFNAFEFGCSIKHFPGDSNFQINDSGLYAVTYKLNIIPSQNGTVIFELRNNGTVLSGTNAIFSLTGGNITAVTYTDVLSLHRNSVLDLQFAPGSSVPVINVIDPFIIIRAVPR